MDYKELIEHLKHAAPCHGTWLRDRMLDSANAIETLLAERDAAVAELERIADFTESEFLGYLNDTIHHECGYEYYCQLFDLLSQVTHWEYDDKWQAQKKGGGT